jgi:steroid delta-isomerase-like uncharacterized protein
VPDGKAAREEDDMEGDAAAALVRRFIDTVWNRGDPDAADGLVTADYLDHAYSGGGLGGLKAALRELGTAVPDHSQVIEDLVASGDRVMARIRLSGTHGGPFRGRAPSGKAIDVRVARWFRVADGRIAEHWALLDTFTLLRQMDVPAAPAA